LFNHLAMKKPSFHYCVRLDTFAFAANPERSTAASPSSAHTYRLLIFKELSLRSSAFFASVIKREANYAMRFRGRQPHPRKKFASTSKSTFMTSAALMKTTIAHVLRPTSQARSSFLTYLATTSCLPRGRPYIWRATQGTSSRAGIRHHGDLPPGHTPLDHFQHISHEREEFAL